MESLYENKPLLYSVGISGAIIFSLAAGWLPDVSAHFEIIDFPPAVRHICPYISNIFNISVFNSLKEGCLQHKLVFKGPSDENINYNF